VVKASVDDTTSENGTARLEFEAVIPNLTLDQLDKQVLDSGFTYQAKWSRERQDFSFKGLNVSIDKNAGYGYLAEFETIVKEMEKADEAKISLRKIMQDLGVAELPQDRLARMFDYYNKNWQNFYGTDKTFIID
jgi:adenylate cyclase class IV